MAVFLFCHRCRLLSSTLFIISVIGPLNNFFCKAELSCSSTKECEKKLRYGSECVDGFCSNPFVKGCIKTMIESGDYADRLIEMGTTTKGTMSSTLSNFYGYDGRVCNSDDNENKYDEIDNEKSRKKDKSNGASNDDDKSNCLPNLLEYPEIRIHNGNWESSIFIAWIMQIVSMEILKVPVTVGLNSGVTNITSFYSSRNTVQYSESAYPWDAFPNVSDNVEDNDDDNKGTYNMCERTTENCVHVLPEVWNGQHDKWEDRIRQGLIEHVQGQELIGKFDWYIPFFTAEANNELVSFHGLQGEKNRHVLAETFKKPMTWCEYCELISDSNCTVPNAVAKRYPKIDDGEGDKYFQEGSYTGHFVQPPESNCTIHPNNCTGYIIAPPCSWSTQVDAQLYWNDIVGLKCDGPEAPNGGYGYGRMIEIWNAANATQSNVMMWWWRPDSLIEIFASSNASFYPVSLPEPTDACFKARVSSDDRCSDDIAIRQGKSKSFSGCANENEELQKAIAATVRKQNSIQPIALQSPIYDFISAFQIHDLKVKTMLKRWISKNVDTYGNDAREVACSYVVENMNTLLRNVPNGYPKTLDDTSPFDKGYVHAATAIAVLCFLWILVGNYLVFRWRLTKVLVLAQMKFVQIIMVGFLFVCMGAFLMSLRPSAFNCVAREWFIYLGYSLELSAILVKVFTINRVLQKSKKMKRVKVSPKAMFGTLALFVVCCLLYLIIWTVVSPPKAVKKYSISHENNKIIEVSLKCESKQPVWGYLPLVWQTLLLLVASVLAFQSRGIISQFNESKTFGIMIYTHFFFMILRSVICYMDTKDLFQPNVVYTFISFTLSLDVLFATVIYILPKFVEAKKNPSKFNGNICGSRVSAATFKSCKYTQDGCSVLRKHPEYTNWETLRQTQASSDQLTVSTGGLSASKDDTSDNAEIASEGPIFTKTVVFDSSKAIPVVSSMEEHGRMMDQLEKKRQKNKSVNHVGEVHQLSEYDQCRRFSLTNETESSIDFIESRWSVHTEGVLKKLSVVLEKHEIPIGMIEKLLMLSEYQSLEFIVDDSISMRKTIDDMLDPITRMPWQRWKEACHRLKEMMELISYVPFEQIDITFVNRADHLKLTHDDVLKTSPEDFFVSSCRKIDSLFKRKPRGEKLVLKKLRDSLEQGEGKKIARYLLSDGEVDVEQRDGIINDLHSRDLPEQNPITFLSCTSNDDAVEWMKDAEEIIPCCSESDDFISEANEVCKDQGVALPYTKGFYLVCQLVAAMNPDDLDAMDESVPFTKYTLDRLLGINLNEETYKYYFDSFLQAQQDREIDSQSSKMDEIRKNTVWNYGKFLAANGPALKVIPETRSMKQDLTDSCSSLHYFLPTD